MAKNIKHGGDTNFQAKSKRKVGPAKVAGIDGAVKDETKETREKVLTGERGGQNTWKRTEKNTELGQNTDIIFAKISPLFVRCK